MIQILICPTEKNFTTWPDYISIILPGIPRRGSFQNPWMFKPIIQNLVVFVYSLCILSLILWIVSLITNTVQIVAGDQQIQIWFLEFSGIFSTIFYTLLIKSEDVETVYIESWFDMFELPGKLHRLLISLLYLLVIWKNMPVTFKS